MKTGRTADFYFAKTNASLVQFLCGSRSHVAKSMGKKNIILIARSSVTSTPASFLEAPGRDTGDIEHENDPVLALRNFSGNNRFRHRFYAFRCRPMIVIFRDSEFQRVCI